MVVMYILLGATAALGALQGMSLWIWPVGISLGLLAPWILWSVRITKWKVWAFSCVRNVHELKKRAIKEKLMWNDNSFFNKTEIWNPADKEQWTMLQGKFDQKDEFIFEDDVAVPAETIIYYSKKSNLIEMVVMIAMFGVGIYFIMDDEYLLGGGLAVIGAFMAFREYRQATNTTPQIILNKEGIQTISTEFVGWTNIEDEDVEQEHTRNTTTTYLRYNYPGGSENLKIDDYEIGPTELKRLLKIYKGRNLKSIYR